MRYDRPFLAGNALGAAHSASNSLPMVAQQLVGTQQMVQSAAAQPVAQPPTALVVGAGPAGVCAATLLAKRGVRVRLFEKRPEPVVSAPRGNRTYTMSLNGRSISTLQAAGLEAPSAPPATTVFFNRIPMAKFPAVTNPLRRIHFADRLRLGEELVQSARLQTFPEGGSIEWHFGQALLDVDFDARTATFMPTGFVTASISSSMASTEEAESGDDAAATSSRIVASYDLLVGADGANSAVRAKMLERKLPGVKQEPAITMMATYKAFHGLRITPTVEKALPGISEQPPGEVLYVYRLKEQLLASTMRKQPDGTVSGILTGPVGWYEDAALHEMLGLLTDKGLEEWHEPIFSQICNSSAQRPSKYTNTFKVSKFDGPGTVLIGDAAHPITPSLGQGCNCALESARVLAETLDKVGLERLDKLPAAYSAARVKDAHAAQDMDFNMAIINVTYPPGLGASRRPPMAWDRFVAFVEMSLPDRVWWPLMRKLFPDKFKEASMTLYLIKQPEIAFSTIHALQRLGGWSVVAGLVAAVAAVGALLRAAAHAAFGV